MTIETEKCRIRLNVVLTRQLYGRILLQSCQDAFITRFARWTPWNRFMKILQWIVTIGFCCHTMSLDALDNCQKKPNSLLSPFRFHFSIRCSVEQINRSDVRGCRWQFHTFRRAIIARWNNLQESITNETKRLFSSCAQLAPFFFQHSHGNHFFSFLYYRQLVKRVCVDRLGLHWDHQIDLITSELRADWLTIECPKYSAALSEM